jgi:hypothetical protein
MHAIVSAVWDFVDASVYVKYVLQFFAMSPVDGPAFATGMMNKSATAIKIDFIFSPLPEGPAKPRERFD